MRTYLLVLLLNLGLLSTAAVYTTAHAETDNAVLSAATPRALPIPESPSVEAKAHVLLDANSGVVLGSSNADQRLPPASLTKIMTLYVIAESLANGRINLDDKVTVSEKAWRMQGSKMFLNVGEQVTVRELIQGIIVASGNDACVTMAEYIAGNEESFVNLMNQEAGRLGMANTHFTDCTGMPDPNHYTSAADLALLARALVNDFPDYYHTFFAQKWLTFHDIKQPNRNRLLWRSNYVDGIKTGHTEEAGFCLVTSGVQNNMRLIAVVLGSSSDANRTAANQALLTYGFRFYETHKLYAAGATIASPRVWLGTHETINLGSKQDIYLTTPIGRYADLKASVNLDKQLRAPIQKGEAVGKLLLKIQDKTLAEVPLLALNSNPKGSFVQRLRDRIALSWQHMWHTDDALS